jgi:hypothetical protein
MRIAPLIVYEPGVAASTVEALVVHHPAGDLIVRAAREAHALAIRFPATQTVVVAVAIARDVGIVGLRTAWLVRAATARASGHAARLAALNVVRRRAEAAPARGAARILAPTVKAVERGTLGDVAVAVRRHAVIGARDVVREREALPARQVPAIVGAPVLVGVRRCALFARRGLPIAIGAAVELVVAVNVPTAVLVLRARIRAA